MMNIRRLKIIGLRVILPGVLLFALVYTLDKALPPDFSRYDQVAREVLDENGESLRVFLSSDGYHRLQTTVDDVDPDYLKLLIAYEDQRFFDHGGVDAKAIARAAVQAFSNRRIISGASTLTMQTAKLLEPRPRTARSKFIEMLRAWQLEHRLTKDEILNIYLTLAPYGGNREGVRAAAHAYFGHGPEELSLAEAALLVALPQSPTKRRPDRNPTAAAIAREKVLRIAAPRLGFSQKEQDIAATAPVEVRLRSLPQLAPHASERALQLSSDNRVESTLNKDLQAHVERLAASHIQSLPPQQSLAILVVENKRREIKAYVGSPDFTDTTRLGAIDMTLATRSPGSTLKPFIYALAFERGILDPKTKIWDGPRQFGHYAPTNFEDSYHGQLSIAQALQKSLNVPAVAVLERLGPLWTAETLKDAGLRLDFGPGNTRPGLAFALGGVGTSLTELVAAYAALADDGQIRPLQLIKSEQATAKPIKALVKPQTRKALKHILENTYVPEGFAKRGRAKNQQGIAFKTGTSYGFRDAWAIGYTDHHIIAVWIGRADGTPSPGQFGAKTAAPLLFRIFELLPPGAQVVYHPKWSSFDRLPPALQYFDKTQQNQSLQIAHPSSGSTYWLPQPGAGLELSVNGGTPPYEWLVNGQPLQADSKWRQTIWKPDGPGFVTLVAIDAHGQRAEATVKISTDPHGPVF